jgi:hypothetical protein
MHPDGLWVNKQCNSLTWKLKIAKMHPRAIISSSTRSHCSSASSCSLALRSMQHAALALHRQPCQMLSILSITTTIHLHTSSYLVKRQDWVA